MWKYKIWKIYYFFLGRLPDHCKAAITEKNRIVQRTFFLFSCRHNISYKSTTLRIYRFLTQRPWLLRPNTIRSWSKRTFYGTMPLFMYKWHKKTCHSFFSEQFQCLFLTQNARFRICNIISLILKQLKKGCCVQAKSSLGVFCSVLSEFVTFACLWHQQKYE